MFVLGTKKAHHHHKAPPPPEDDDDGDTDSESDDDSKSSALPWILLGVVVVLFVLFVWFIYMLAPRIRAYIARRRRRGSTTSANQDSPQDQTQGATADVPAHFTASCRKMQFVGYNSLPFVKIISFLIFDIVSNFPRLCRRCNQSVGHLTGRLRS